MPALDGNRQSSDSRRRRCYWYAWSYDSWRRCCYDWSRCHYSWCWSHCRGDCCYNGRCCWCFWRRHRWCRRNDDSWSANNSRAAWSTRTADNRSARHSYSRTARGHDWSARNSDSWDSSGCDWYTWYADSGTTSCCNWNSGDANSWTAGNFNGNAWGADSRYAGSCNFNWYSWRANTWNCVNVAGNPRWTEFCIRSRDIIDFNIFSRSRQRHCLWCDRNNRIIDIVNVFNVIACWGYVICSLIQEFADAFRYMADIEGVIEINNNVCTFDRPNAIFLYDFEKHAVGIDWTAVFDHIFAVALCDFNVALSGLKIVHAADNQVLYFCLWNFDWSVNTCSCRRLS